jgi:DNA-binding NarL/FixJ family response regulator
LVVEDDPKIQVAVTRVLESHGAKVAVASSVDEAKTVICKSRPFDAAVIDYDLPDHCGLAIISALRSGSRPCCALMITGHADPDFGLQAIAAGADDFLLKPFVAQDLITAVTRTVQQTQQWRKRLGGEVVSVNGEGELGAVGLPEYDVCVRELCRMGGLTVRERQVLEQILLGKTNRDAGAAIGLTERTVKYHMAKILKKIGVTSRSELIRLLFRN